MSGTAAEKRPSYGLFALAAAMYTAGIVAFSIWSYAQQRANILAQVDQSLINATHATEQILGDVFIACAVETHSAYNLGYAGNQSNLDRFAENCGFNLLAAVAYQGGELQELITGGMDDGRIPNRQACINDLIRTTLAPVIHDLASSGTDSIRMETIELEHCGTLHIAVRYHPLADNEGYSILVGRSMQKVTHSINLLAIRTAGIGLLLYTMAFPLIILYHFARARSLRETAELHDRLQEDYVQLKERESELEDAVHDLERFNAVTIGREGRIIELKAEVNTLLEQMNQNKRYHVDHMD